MWPFSKKRYSILESGLLQGMTDCHCHILPGVDDGIQTMDEALRALQKMSELGVREIWLTPHIMEDIPNSPEDLRRRFAELNDNDNDNVNANENEDENEKGNAVKVKVKVNANANENENEKGNAVKVNVHVPVDVPVHLAAEHMLDNLFIQRFAANDLLPYQSSPLSPLTSHASPISPLTSNHSPLLLVETSYFHPPMGLYDILENIRKKGYTPLLAHPERYMYMDDADYRRLQDMGVKLQLNILSLAGAYGETAARKSHHLLHQGAYSCMGSDLHNLDSFLEYVNVKCLTKKEIYLLQSIKGTQLVS